MNFLVAVCLQQIGFYECERKKETSVTQRCLKLIYLLNTHIGLFVVELSCRSKLTVMESDHVMLCVTLREAWFQGRLWRVFGFHRDRKWDCSCRYIQH